MTDWSFVQARILETVDQVVDIVRESVPSRRERIAMAAMQGLLASDTGYRDKDGFMKYSWDPSDPNGPCGAAMAAVRMADALIAELDKKRGQP